jgi:hypothetical protein
MSSSKVRKFKHVFTSTPLNSAPAMSSDIQASLLQVGMRVRKSVGQGYRTQLALEEDKMRAERSKLAAGLGRQSSFKSANIKIMVDDVPFADQEEPFWSSSQESSSSVETLEGGMGVTPVLPLMSKKRAQTFDDDLEDPIGVDNQMDATSTCLRPIAQAKTRQKFTAGMLSSTTDLKKLLPSDDFGEADFLDSTNRDEKMGEAF